MPHPVVSFEINGPDADALRAFYAQTFGWDMSHLPGGYTIVETSQHDHTDDGGTVYTGVDANRNEGVSIGSEWGQPVWRFSGEPRWRAFEAGIGGGIGQQAASITFYVQVDDLDAMLDRAVANGGTRRRAPEAVAPGVAVATFADPAGNVVGLISYSEA